MTMMFAAALLVSSTAEHELYARVELGPRVDFLVNDMDSSPLKTKFMQYARLCPVPQAKPQSASSQRINARWVALERMSCYLALTV